MLQHRHRLDESTDHSTVEAAARRSMALPRASTWQGGPRPTPQRHMQTWDEGEHEHDSNEHNNEHAINNNDNNNNDNNDGDGDQAGNGDDDDDDKNQDTADGDGTWLD